ncbi:MAG: hypothetical protein LWW81_06815 [Rhodocyclales bacterium]|nr:hypothetical protein [Rhodocyclales bacterium]
MADAKKHEIPHGVVRQQMLTVKRGAHRGLLGLNDSWAQKIAVDLSKQAVFAGRFVFGFWLLCNALICFAND